MRDVGTGRRVEIACCQAFRAGASGFGLGGVECGLERILGVVGLECGLERIRGLDLGFRF